MFSISIFSIKKFNEDHISKPMQQNRKEPIILHVLTLGLKQCNFYIPSVKGYPWEVIKVALLFLILRDTSFMYCMG